MLAALPRLKYNDPVNPSHARPAVGLMATLLSTSPTYRSAGIHQYSQALLAHLPQAAPDLAFHAFVMDAAYHAPSGIILHRANTTDPSPWHRILWEQTHVAWTSHRWKLDLLHGLAYALPLAWRGPAVVTVHDLTFLHFPHAFPKAKQQYLAHMTAVSCRRAQAILADSQATARDIQRMLHIPAENIHVVYPGVEERYRPLPPAQVEAYRQKKGWPARFLLMVGTLEPRKNHLGLIEAYALYRQQARTPLPLLIGGGKGWYYQAIFQRVQSLGLESHVHFLGFVPWEDLPWLYNAATLFLYPSRYEGFGLPVVEAMRCGTPVITSTVSSLPEVAGDAALTIPPDEPQALAQAILLVTEQEPQRLTIMRERGLKHAAQFQWNRAARQTVDIYARILSPHA